MVVRSHGVAEGVIKMENLNDRNLSLDSEGYLNEPWTLDDLTAHPIAACWPMEPTSRLEALGIDIETNGQAELIVLDGVGRIVDGRNRFAACKLRKIPPRFMIWHGEDATVLDFILSRNQFRRHTTKTQDAFTAARIETLG
jgi:hypothetical protein